MDLPGRHGQIRCGTISVPNRDKDTAFDIVGPPRPVDGFTGFIPMQVFGPHGEVLFLNQVNHSDEDVDLPKTKCVVGEIFIVVLATRDRASSVAEYVQRLQLDEAATHSFRYSMLNRAFGLPAATTQTITMVQNGRSPLAQIDQYWLPAGNAMVSILVDDLDALSIDQMVVGPELSPSSYLYGGRRTRVVRGGASELIELIEIRKDH
ncbi:MAG: hypothetical protein AB8G16_15730 [Gammaproteobacteria bacterium]